MADLDGIRSPAEGGTSDRGRGTSGLVMMQPMSKKNPDKAVGNTIPNSDDERSADEREITNQNLESIPLFDSVREQKRDESNDQKTALMIQPDGIALAKEIDGEPSNEIEDTLDHDSEKKNSKKPTKTVAFKDTENHLPLLESPRETKRPEIFLESKISPKTSMLPRLEDIPVKFPGQFTNRRERIVASLGKESIKSVSIPSHHVTENIVLYEVEVANKNYIWNLWLRFDQFHRLHLRLSELASEYTMKYSPRDNSRYNLPPFPVKQPKIIVDHKSRQFVEERRTLLENYLQKILNNEEFRHYEAFVTFLLPPKKEVAIPRKPRAEPSRKSKSKRNREARSKSYKFGCRLLELSERDEITAIHVSRSQVTDTHTVYQVNLSNENKPVDVMDWRVFKRYGDFASFDASLRKEIAAKYPDCLKFLPPIPSKSSKLLVDHKDPVFIERRRVLLDSYCQNLIKYPVFRRHALAIEFFEVKFGP